MTNYEKIKSMNLEELGYFLSDIQWDSNEPTGQEMIFWLLEEYENVCDAKNNTCNVTNLPCCYCQPICNSRNVT